MYHMRVGSFWWNADFHHSSSKLACATEPKAKAQLKPTPLIKLHPAQKAAVAAGACRHCCAERETKSADAAASPFTESAGPGHICMSRELIK